MQNKHFQIPILVAGICIVLLLGSCRTSPIPITEAPIAQMSPTPSRGVAGADSIGDPFIPTLGNTGYDVQAYNLELAFSTPLDAITGTVTISSSVTLDNLGRISLDFTSYQVDSVKVGRKYAQFYRSPQKLYIDLPSPLKIGKLLVVQVSYHGKIQSFDSPYLQGISLGFKTFPGKNLVYAFGEPDGAHAWFPCNDHPLDKATYRFELAVPRGLTGVANGTLQSSGAAGNRDHFTWVESRPMATYLATVVVGDYERVDQAPFGDVKIRDYLIRNDFDFSHQLSSAGEMLKFYSDLIAPYPFDEYGTIIILQDFSGPSFAEENQTIVLMSRDWMFIPQAEGILAHEMVHQWFGDSVSLAKWNEVWLKEGMANYLMTLWLEHAQGLSVASMMGDWEELLNTHPEQATQSLDQPDLSTMYGANTYDKGAWVFHMLRQEIGDEAFFKFIKEYYRRFAGSSATTADLQKVAEEVSGKDLAPFFKQWVYGSGNPQFHLTWTQQGGEVSVQVCQVGELFTLPLELRLDEQGGASADQTLQVDQVQERVTYSGLAPVTGLVADPDQKVLADVTISQVETLQGCQP